jgi:hypothetical protein
MTPEELFTAALGLGRQWRVAQCRFEGEPKRLELRLEHVPGEHFECPVCKDLCGIHDTIERRWRHMDFFQYRCELVARVPRTWCRKDGVHQVQVPWAREGSGFTLMMEALMMLLSAEMPVDAMADLLDEHDTRLWRVLMHYVEQAHAKSDWRAVRRIAVDETSARRGHRYVTNVLDAENSRLLLMVEGRSAEALAAFAKALVEHGGDPSQIKSSRVSSPFSTFAIRLEDRLRIGTPAAISSSASFNCSSSDASLPALPNARRTLANMAFVISEARVESSPGLTGGTISGDASLWAEASTTLGPVSSNFWECFTLSVLAALDFDDFIHLHFERILLFPKNVRHDR